MQSSSVQPEAILRWLQDEMGYRPLGPYSANAAASTSRSQLPSVESLGKVCRGNMIPIWDFLVKRVKSERTVEDIRRNIIVHGSSGVGERGGRKKEGGGRDREVAERERDEAGKEVKRLRDAVRRQRDELRKKMVEVSREETERKRMLDERVNYRHKQVMLEAYDQQCSEAVKIFAEYHKRLCYYVDQARDAQRLCTDSFPQVDNNPRSSNDKEAVYSTVRSSKSADDVLLIETTRERNIRKACESLAARMVEKICSSFPAYDGCGILSNPQLEAAKLGLDFDGEIPDDIQTFIVNGLRSPPQLLQAITSYTMRLTNLIAREKEKIDVRADAEALRYKYENNRVIDVSSPSASSPLHYQLYGNEKIGGDVSVRGSQNQLLERQKAHFQQFLATEDAQNKAAEARDMCQKLIKRLQGNGDIHSQTYGVGGMPQNVSSIRQFALEVWAKEREAAGLRASLSTLISEIERLNKLCSERKEAEDSLKKKWKKIEEFDARRSELESIYTALLKANMDAAAFWNQQPLAAREYASTTISPACTAVVDISNIAKDLIDKEVSAFYQSPDNSLYMLPSNPQALLESMGASGATGPEAVAAVERNAALLTARAGAGDPSAIPSICRISAALQYPSGLGSDAALVSVLESLEFCLKLRGSEASVLEDLAKAVNLVHTRQDLVENGRALLNHAKRAQQDYERTTSYCLNLAAEQEKTVVDKWLPELKDAVLNAETSLKDCKYVRGLLDEWWEQPASTVVDWATIDGQNVAAWQNHVKQLLTLYDK